MVYFSLDTFPKGEFCKFCRLTTVDAPKLGNIYQTGDIIVHYFCLLLASKGLQRGTDKQGLLGFLPRDIKKEIYRGSTIQCVYCKRPGATVICSKKKCKSNFHLPCGLKKGSLHFFCNNFESLCAEHRPKDVIPDVVMRGFIENKPECIICFSSVTIKDKYNLIWPPCCKPSSILHKKCVQEMAYAAGYYFKCPFCADTEIFNQSLRQSGIYIPEQEASWESEPHAFSDFNIFLKCASKSCVSPRGPVYSRRSSKWQLENCTICGSKAIHLACSGIWKPKSPFVLDWECPDCVQLKKEINCSKTKNENNAIVSRFSLIGGLCSFLSSYTTCSTWKNTNNFQNKFPINDGKNLTGISKSGKLCTKNLFLFITDDLLISNLYGLDGVKEVIVNNKRCMVLVEKLKIDDYKKDDVLTMTVDVKQNYYVDKAGSIGDGCSKKLLPSESFTTEKAIKSSKSQVDSFDDFSKILPYRKLFLTDNINNNVTIDNGSASSDNSIPQTESIMFQLYKSLDASSLKQLYGNKIEEKWNNYSKISIPNSLIIEYKTFFKHFKDIHFLYNNENCFKLAIRRQVRQVRHYSFKPYVRTTKTKSIVSSNFALWSYFYETGVIKKKTRWEILSMIKNNHCVIFTDSSGLIYADIIKSIIPQDWPEINIFSENNSNLSDLLIKAHYLLLTSTRKCTVFLILSPGIWCESSKELLYLLQKIVRNKNYGNLVICQIPSKMSNGRFQNRQTEHSSNQLLQFSKKNYFKVWNIMNIFL